MRTELPDPEPELPPGGVPEDGSAWSAWSPAEVADRLAAVNARWCVAGGWALDLFVGEKTREHEDLEVAVPADDFPAVRSALAGFDLYVVGSGHRWPLDSMAFSVFHQTWVWEPAARAYRLDVFREPHDGDAWIARRDESIRMPYRELIEHTSDGIPYARPEVVLLFKAKHAREKDDGDLAAALPHLDARRRRWLADALALVHPGHRWIAEVG